MPATPIWSSANAFAFYLAAQKALAEHAYGVFLAPDMILSDGSVAALERHAAAGKKVVLVSAVALIDVDSIGAQEIAAG